MRHGQDPERVLHEAGALFLFEKTVEHHLSRIYANLDVRSRTELAGVLRPGV